MVEEPWPLPAQWQSFHGQMLINWFVSAFSEDHYLRQSLKHSDLRIIAAQFCTHLLAAGVVRQLPDKDAPQCEALFRPDLIYFWSHTEAVNAAPPTPGRLSTVAWPPPLSPTTLQDIQLNFNGNTASDAQYHEKENNIITELSRKVQQQRLQIDELEAKIEKLQQEKERNKTLADIQSLVDGVKADFDSPTKEKLSSPKTRDSTSKTQNGHHINNNDVSSRLESKIISSHKDQNSEGKFTSILITERVEVDRSIAESSDTVPSSFFSGIPLTPDKSVLTPEKVEIENNVATRTLSNENSSSQSIPSDQDHIASKHSEEKVPEASQLTSPQVPLSPKIQSTPLRNSPVPCPLSQGVEIPPIEQIESKVVSIPPPLTPIQLPIPPPPPLPTSAVPCTPPPPPPPPPVSYLGPPPPPPLPISGICTPPPPPIPGIGPPPPPIPGIGPPPPPIPGIGPPPPPIPGIGPPPPPPPGPPLPLSGVPPPPPAPGLIPPPSPTPFPSPPIGGWNAHRSNDAFGTVQEHNLGWVTANGFKSKTFRKKPLNPTIPMKPLYWTRVVVPPSATTTTEVDGHTTDDQSLPLWGELEEAKVENIDEFAQLFSRQVIDRKNTKKKVVKPVKAQVAKILDSKRSQNVGILAKSLHADFGEIENAIYNFDTSIVNLEALQQIYEVRATEEELLQLRSHIDSQSDQPLDKPEQFLLELAGIPHFAERIACFVFQTEYSDNMAAISSKLNNINSTCQFLMSSESLKTVLGIILALGNYMNGGNMQRGQADGFGLEILAKLKDVKSKDNSMTLLHFIVVTHMRQCGADDKLPIPEPSDIERASAVQFDDMKAQLTGLGKELEGCQRKMETVLSQSSEENVEPFKEKMEHFLSTAKKQLAEELENCEECTKKFHATLKFYQFQPKGGMKEDEIAPKDFFPLWAPFCSDFKDLWQKEQQRIIKEKLKEVKRKQDERKQEVKKGKSETVGLKSQMKKRFANSSRL